MSTTRLRTALRPVEESITVDTADDGWDAPPHTDDDAPATGRAPKAAAMTEIEIADRLVDRFGEDLRYCAALGGWYEWTGSHWRRDDREVARERAKDVARELARDAAGTMDKKLFEVAASASRASGVSAVLNLARSVPGIVFTADDANRDPYLLTCSNGTLDLRTGELREHRRDDLITRCSPVSYDAAAACPRFDAFLAEVQPDIEVRDYLARLFGYALTGIVNEHVLGVLWGAGANGKSVFIETVMHCMGDYGRPGPSSLIVANGAHEPHPTDVASCMGARLVVVHETKRGASFDASKVKLLTGGDQLTARHMRQDFFAFSPTHTLIMLSNYKPAADGGDAALWRRVQLVPFDVVIPEERRDRHLAAKIKAEAPGVLAWLVRGCIEWQRIGLATPAVIREQTESYRASEDTIADFIADKCVVMPDVKVSASALYAAYRSYTEAQGGRATRANDFAAEILARGFHRTRHASGRLYEGIGLASDDQHDDSGRYGS